MKIIVRTLIILVAALAVVGVASALNSAGALSNLGSGREGLGGGRPFGREFNGQPLTAGTRPNFEEGSFQRGGFGRDSANLFGLAEVGKNLLIMVVITIVIVLASRVLRLLRSNRSASPPGAASTQ